MKTKKIAEYLDDPTFTGTVIGIIFLLLGLPGWVAGLPWAIVGIGGVAIALYMHVYTSQKTWGWQSFHHHVQFSTTAAIAGHLPQAILGVLLLMDVI